MRLSGYAREFSQRHHLSRIDGIYTLLTLAALLPALLVRFPVSQDYINHLFRVYVLTAPARAPAHTYILPHWHLLANLGLDLLSWPFAKLFSPDIAMKTVWEICIAGMAAGAWYLHRAFHRITQPTLLFVPLLLYNVAMETGLLNYMLGFDLAFFAIGYWLRTQPNFTWRRYLIFNLLTLAAMICHVAAAAGLGLTILLLQILQDRRIRLHGLINVVSGFVLSALWFLAVALSHPVISSTTKARAIWYTLDSKLQLFTAPIKTGMIPADILGAVIWLVGLWYIIRIGKARLEKTRLWLVLGWLIVVCAMPFGIGNGYYTDSRLTLFPALLCLCAFEVPQTRTLGVFYKILAVAILFRFGNIPYFYTQYNKNINELSMNYKAINNTSKTITAKNDLIKKICFKGTINYQDYNHSPILSMITKGTFVSSVFADPDLQPIIPKPTVASLVKPDAGPEDLSLLLVGDAAQHDPKYRKYMKPVDWRYYPKDWKKNYDYMVLIRNPCIPDPRKIKDLTLIKTGSYYNIYKIRHTR